MSAAEREMVSERELLELFRRRRPEPEAFRAGVERRIEEQRREAAERAERERRDPPRVKLVRRVAAVLPPDSLGGALLGSAAAKAAGAKLLPTVLALPALLLGAVLGGFAAGARSLARTIRGAPAATRAPEEREFREDPAPVNPDLEVGARLRFWMRAGGGLTIVALSFLGGRWVTDVLVAILLVSIAALVVTVRGLAREAWLSRAEVARLCAGLLATCLGGVLIFQQCAWYRLDVNSDLGAGWAVGTVFFGSVACTCFAKGASGARRHLGWLLLVLAFNPFGCSNSTPRFLRAQLERLNEDDYVPRKAEEVLACYETLRGIGSELPDLAPFERRVSAWIDNGWSMGWADLIAARTGLIDLAHWRVLASTHARQVEGLGTLDRIRQGSTAEFLMRVLLATREPSAEERDRLVELVERSWPDPSEYSALENAAACIRLLDLLGRSDRVDERRGDVHELLRGHWVPDRWGLGSKKLGGFDGVLPPDYSSVEDTAAALELMVRLGVPEGIDLRLLHGYLRGESRVWFLPFDLGSSHKALARAGLLRLEREIGLPPRTWLEALVGERLLISAVLVVALCFLAIRLAPPVQSAEAGAQP